MSKQGNVPSDAAVDGAIKALRNDLVNIKSFIAGEFTKVADKNNNVVDLNNPDFQVAIESLIKAAVSRFRPVILTTITTVVGLLPVAHMPGGDPFLKPMATSFAYGLLFSTTITLIFVPTCYLLYMRILEFFQKAKHLE